MSKERKKKERKKEEKGGIGISGTFQLNGRDVRKLVYTERERGRVERDTHN